MRGRTPRNHGRQRRALSRSYRGRSATGLGSNLLVLLKTAGSLRGCHAHGLAVVVLEQDSHSGCSLIKGHALPRLGAATGQFLGGRGGCGRRRRGRLWSGLLVLFRCWCLIHRSRVAGPRRHRLNTIGLINGWSIRIAQLAIGIRPAINLRMGDGAVTEQAQQQRDTHVASIAQAPGGRWCPRVALFAAATLVSACGGSGVEAPLSDYAWRVSNVLAVDAEPPQRQPVPLYPRRRLRQLALPELRLSPGQALRFRFCLGRELGERNSILGQVMQPSIRFAYETRVAAALPDCEPESEADRRLLEQIRDTKARSLHIAGHNLLFTAEEVEAFFGATTEPVSPSDLRHGLTGTQALADLAALVRRGVQGDVVTSAELADALQRLRESRQAAGLMRTARLFQAYMDAVANAINLRLDTRAICLQPQPTRTARIAETVFDRFYVEQLQPNLAEVQRALARLDQAVLAALQATPAPPSNALMRYVHASQALHQDLVAASRRHAQAWQRLLGQCGRMPDRSDSDLPS